MGLVGSAVGFANKGWVWVGLYVPDDARHGFPMIYAPFDNTQGFCDNRKPITSATRCCHAIYSLTI
jgi:hypothetical protein